MGFLLLLFSGCIAAFIFLLVATFCRGATRRIFLFLALLGLVRGCALAAVRFGQATGGGGDSSFVPVTIFACVPFVVWAFWLGAGSSAPSGQWIARHAGRKSAPGQTNAASAVGPKPKVGNQ